MFVRLISCWPKMEIFCSFSAGPAKLPSSLPPVNICWPEVGSAFETRTWSLWWWGWWRWCRKVPPQRCAFSLHSSWFCWRSQPSGRWLECQSRWQARVQAPHLCGKGQYRRSRRHQGLWCFRRCIWLHGGRCCFCMSKTWSPSPGSALALPWKAAVQPGESLWKFAIQEYTLHKTHGVMQICLTGEKLSWKSVMQLYIYLVQFIYLVHVEDVFVDIVTENWGQTWIRAQMMSIASEKEVGQYFMNYEDALKIGQLCSQTSLEYIVLCHWSKAPGYKYKIGKHGKGNPPTVCLVATIIDQNEPI